MSESLPGTASAAVEALGETVRGALTDPEIDQYSFGAEVDTDWAVGSPIRFRASGRARRSRTGRDPTDLLTDQQRRFVTAAMA